MLAILIKTYSAKNIFLKTVGVSFLLGLIHYMNSSSGPSLLDSAVYSLKFLAFLLGGYSLIQTWGRRTELAERRKELDAANGDPAKVRKIQQQLNNIKTDKETGEFFMLLAFFITLTLSMFGKA